MGDSFAFDKKGLAIGLDFRVPGAETTAYRQTCPEKGASGFLVHAPRHRGGPVHSF